MKKKIVILGAGFAGLQLARNLSHQQVDITLIDQYNFHQFQPLFYQVATARLEPSSISFPLRKVFQKNTNVHVRMGIIKHVDTNRGTVFTDTEQYNYDQLVVATGCTTNFFGNEHFARYAFPMKSTNEALSLRNRILLNFEDAQNAEAAKRSEIMNIVVIGGGPTGVELAGALAEMRKYVLPKDYPDMDFSPLHIFLVEGSDHTLQVMSKASQQKSLTYLEDLGVEVILNNVAEDYDGHTLTLKDGRSIPTRTVIWSAGIIGNLPEGFDKSVIAKGNRLFVDDTNKVKGLANVYAIGDIAYMETEEYPKGHPQLANVAIKQAKNLSRNIKRALQGKNLIPFSYTSPGTMATIGKHKAVVDLPFMSFQGRLAWFVWMFLHLMLILSVRNKLFIFINWMISYFTNDTTLRLILRPSRCTQESR